MDPMPSSKDPIGSDDEPPLACILHPTRGVVTGFTTELSFKSRARNQILRLHRELVDEREKHERVVKEMREQNKEDVVSLSSRVQYFEAQWSRLQRRMSELWLEVEGLKLPGHMYTLKADASTQTSNNSATSSSTQTPENSSTNASTQTPENAHSNLGVKVAAATENELKRWQTAFNHLSGTPERIALDSKLTNKELKDWRTAFEHISGTPAQKAASSKEDIDELKKWRISFNHVSGSPAQRAEASKTFLRRFSQEQAKNSGLLRTENALRKQVQSLETKIKEHEHDNAKQESEIRGLQQRNLSLSTKNDKEMSEREKLLRAVEEYQGTSNPQYETETLASATRPSSSRYVSDNNKNVKPATIVPLPKRKREVSDPDSQQKGPLPASRRRRLKHSDPGSRQNEGQRTIMAAPQDAFGYWGPPVPSTMWSIPPTGEPMGSSWGMISALPTAPYPPYYPTGPSGIVDGTWRDNGDIETFAPGRVLDTRSSSTASTTDSSSRYESMKNYYRRSRRSGNIPCSREGNGTVHSECSA